MEDEGSLSEFLENHPDFKIDKIKPDFGFEESKILPGTIRLFPHKIKGEGHFVASLKKDDRAVEKNENKTKIKNTFGISIPYWMDSLKVCMERLLNEQ